MTENPSKKTSKPKRTTSVKIRLTPSEYDELLVRKDKPKLATWIRETCLAATPITPSKFAKIDPKLLYQINKIGNNLNQLAKQVNTQPATLQTAQALATLAQIQADIHEIKTQLSDSL
ncbi:MobC family plasmid mobilization relaxosome protein [Moraxella sp. Tifton1]|uniref:plasmid mobilization protein n=1 Tax=Moraxella oculi TaxID=2940516 RepID=UPI002011C97F|nr:plasmid mobilization relaxosome protein MobC [Moraxella sp. Tifton1]MCL1624294.1 MobC family plasmid mobilization relaxosome protein [Moraxella sp. Tifton1]